MPDDLERRAMRRVTGRLIPLLCACFVSAFLDRVNIGFARAQMVADLGWDDTVYGLGAGVFFVGYFLFEVPSNLILERVGARLWIARIMIAWGLISAAMAFVGSATSFYVLRFLLGVGEAGFFPGVIFYLTRWFPAAHRTRAVSLFVTAAVASSVIGSPLSGLLLSLDGVLGLRGWKWLFLIEGLPPVVLGLVVLAVLPDRPEQARWLPAPERDLLLARLRAERERAPDAGATGSVLRAWTRPGLWLLCLAYFINVMAGYGLDFFQPTLLQQAFPALAARGVGLLNAVPAACAVAAMVWWGRSSDRRRERRWHFALAMLAGGLGLALAAWPLPALVTLAGMVLAVCGRWSAIAPFWALATAQLPARAAAGAIAFINAVGNLGGLAGPVLMGRVRDATGSYLLGLQALAIAMAVGGAAALLSRPPP